MRVIAKKGNGFGCAAFNHASNQGNHKNHISDNWLPCI